MRAVLTFLSLFLSCAAFAQDMPPPHVKEAEPTPFICGFDLMPQYPGGEMEMMKFIQTHLHYPDSAAARGMEGRVVIKFTIDETGQPGEFTLVRSVYPELDAEALRVARLLPRFKWSSTAKPGKVSFALPITFKLSADPVVISRAAPPRVNVPHIYDKVDQMPQFLGGDDSLMAFIARNLNYPTPEEPVRGRVVLGFVVNEDGSISDIAIRKKLENHYDAEAIRVIRLFPAFIPGRLQGKAVKVSYVLPIGFGLK